MYYESENRRKMREENSFPMFSLEWYLTTLKWLYPGYFPKSANAMSVNLFPSCIIGDGGGADTLAPKTLYCGKLEALASCLLLPDAVLGGDGENLSLSTQLIPIKTAVNGDYVRLNLTLPEYSDAGGVRANTSIEVPIMFGASFYSIFSYLQFNGGAVSGNGNGLCTFNGWKFTF